jgi:hypothetical protein
MKNNTTAILLILLIALAACREEQIPLYNGGNNIQFVKNLTTDSSSIVFLLAPGKTEIDSALIIKTTGLGYPTETAYKISVDRQFTTAIEGTHFKLPDTTTFKPNAMRDTLFIKFYRTPDLKTNTVRLVLRLEENDAFKLGQIEYRYKVFLVNDLISQPEWWTASVVTSYLGAYSNRKYQTFIDVTGIADLTGASPSELRIYALQLKYYLGRYKLEHGLPLLEEDGSEMVVPING